MTELYKRSLTDRREALAKHRPVYFARRKRISMRNYSAHGLSDFIKKKPQNIQNFLSIQTSFPLP